GRHEGARVSFQHGVEAAGEAPDSGERCYTRGNGQHDENESAGGGAGFAPGDFARGAPCAYGGIHQLTHFISAFRSIDCARSSASASAAFFNHAGGVRKGWSSIRSREGGPGGPPRTRASALLQMPANMPSAKSTGAYQALPL